MGIIQDVIQNHLIFVLAQIIGTSEKVDRKYVLNQMTKIANYNCKTSTYSNYGGTPGTPTEASCNTSYKNIELNIHAGKRQKKSEYSITVYCKDYRHVFKIQPESIYELWCGNVLIDCETLPIMNAYENVIMNALENKIHLFPDPEEISRSWEIVENIL